MEPSFGTLLFAVLLGLAGCAFTVTGLDEPPASPPTGSGSDQSRSTNAIPHPLESADLSLCPDPTSDPPGDLALPETPDLSPSCSDGITDGKETDVDCGGPDCPKCGVARACQVGTDCVTLLCLFARCAL
jgi:hypothetical protein